MILIYEKKIGTLSSKYNQLHQFKMQKKYVKIIFWHSLKIVNASLI